LHLSVLYRLIADEMKQVYCQHNSVEAVRTISPTEYKIQLTDSAARFARQSIIIGPIDNRNWMFSPIEEAQPSVVIAGVSQDLPIDFILQEIRQYNNWPYGKDPEKNITQLTRLSRKMPWLRTIYRISIPSTWTQSRISSLHLKERPAYDRRAMCSRSIVSSSQTETTNRSGNQLGQVRIVQSNCLLTELQTLTG